MDGTDKKTAIVYVVVICAFMYLFHAAQVVINTSHSGYVDTQMHGFIYNCTFLIMFLGFAFYQLINFSRLKGFIRVFGIVSVPLFSFAFIAICFFSANPGYYRFAPVSAIFLGFLGGFIYNFAAANIRLLKHGFFLFCLAEGISLILQVIISWIFGTGLTVFILCVISYAAVMVYMIIHFEDIPLKGLPESKRRDSISSSHIVIICLIVVVILFISDFFDKRLDSIGFISEYTAANPYNYTRILFALSYPVLGLIAEYKRGRILPYIIFALTIGTVLLSVLSSGAFSYDMLMLAFYIYVSSTYTYFNWLFLTIAMDTERPGTVASLWRMVDLVIEFLLGLLPLADVPINSFMIIQTLMMIILFLIMLLGKQFDIIHEKEVIKEIIRDREVIVEKTPVKPTEDEMIDNFARKFSLTPREKDVLRCLVTGDDIGDVIADDLSISRRQLQKHIASIYEKTDTASRVGLVMKYYNV